MADYAIPVARRHYASRALIAADTQIGPQEWVYNEGEKEIGVLQSDGTTMDYISAAKLFNDSDGAYVLDCSDGDCTIIDEAAIKGSNIDCFVSFGDIGSGILGLSGDNGVEVLNPLFLRSEIKLDSKKIHTETTNFNADLDGYCLVQWAPSSPPGGDVVYDLTADENSRQLFFICNNNTQDISSLELNTGVATDGVDGALIDPYQMAIVFYDGAKWWMISSNY